MVNIGRGESGLLSLYCGMPDGLYAGYNQYRKNKSTQSASAKYTRTRLATLKVKELLGKSAVLKMNTE